MEINGIIMQRKTTNFYQGIEGDNWYLNDEFSDEVKEFYDSNIDKSWCDNEYVDVCIDTEYIRKYIRISEANNIKYRIILCITEKSLPHMCIQDNIKSKFIGFDYAYPGGSFYSAVNSDVVSKRIPYFNSILLNQYGLFETCNEVTNFAKLRELLKDDIYTFEEGDFVIFKLYEIEDIF